MLGLRFDVLVLVPAILLGWILAVIGGFLAGGAGLSILLGMALVAGALQGGYIGGVLVLWVMGSTRALPKRWAAKPAAAPDSAF